MTITADWYVDSTAAGLNDGTSWTDAAQSFEYMAETLSPTLDDVFFVANDHAAVYASNLDISMLKPQRSLWVSVDPADDSYTPGATETLNNTLFGIIHPGDHFGCTFGGITFESTSAFSTANSLVNVRVILHESTVKSITIYGAANDGSVAKFNDCTWYGLSQASGRIFCGNGGHVHIDNMQAHASHTKVDSLFEGIGNGSAHFVCENTDLSALIVAGGDIAKLPLIGDDSFFLKLRRCKLPATWDLFSSTPVNNKNIYVDIAECDAGDGYGYFLYYDGVLGQVEQDTAQYLNDTYDGTTFFSAQFDTNANTINVFNPLKYKLGTLPAQDLSSSKTVSIELSGPAGLTDADVYAVVVVSDNTDLALGKKYTSLPADPVSGTSALTSSSAVWNITTGTEYKIDVVIPALANATNSNVDVYLCVGKPSVAGLNAAMPTIANT